MLSEDANEKSINLAVRIGKITGTELKKAIDKLLKDWNSNNKQQENLKPGRTTLKQLSKDNDGLSTVELSQPHLRDLNNTMKKHGVSFAITKDGKNMYTLFFKGKDRDSVEHALKKFSKKELKDFDDRNKPGIKKTLESAKQKSQILATKRSKEKNMNKGSLQR